MMMRMCRNYFRRWWSTLAINERRDQGKGGVGDYFWIVSPKPLEREGYKFYFWSDEGSEPPHVHVSRGDGNAKWWLAPELKEEYAYGSRSQERKRIKQLITEHHEVLLRAWKTHFGK